MAEDRARGLGRGLSSLIGSAPALDARTAKAQRTLPVAFLRANRFQPRKTFEDAELEELANSIREKGVLLPILVRPIAGEAGQFEIVAGERRWRAAQLAKLHEVPVVVRELSDAESLELSIIENVQRADLNAIEEAAAYQELIERFGYTQEKLATEVGKSRSHIANILRLLKLPESVKALVRGGKLTAGHARTLVGRPDAEALAQQILEGGLNVRQAEQRTHRRKAHRAPEKDPDTRALEHSLGNVLGLKVDIADRGDAGGHLTVSYRTLEQLDDLIRRLSRP